VRILFTLILMLPLVARQSEETVWYGVVILKDGRTISTIGSPEVLGDEVRFIDLKDELVLLPTRLVDVEQTQAKNKILENNLEQRRREVPDDGSLYAKWARSDKKKTPQDGLVLDDANSIYAKWTRTHKWKDPQEGLVINEKALGKTGETAPDGKSALEEMLGKIQKWAEHLVQEAQYNRVLRGALVIYALAALLFAIIGFATKIYLTFTSFQDGFAWGLAMVFFGFSHWFLSCANLLIQEDVFQLVSGGLSLLQYIVIPLYILRNCYSRKWKLLFLWGLFPLWTFGGGLALFLYFRQILTP
jgi:hypothetical protein